MLQTHIHTYFKIHIATAADGTQRSLNRQHFGFGHVVDGEFGLEHVPVLRDVAYCITWRSLHLHLQSGHIQTERIAGVTPGFIIMTNIINLHHYVNNVCTSNQVSLIYFIHFLMNPIYYKLVVMFYSITNCTKPLHVQFNVPLEDNRDSSRKCSGRVWLSESLLDPYYLIFSARSCAERHSNSACSNHWFLWHCRSVDPCCS